MNLKEKLATAATEEIKSSAKKECLVEEAVLDMYENMCQFVNDLDLDNEDIKDRVGTKSTRASETTEHVIAISANTVDFSSLPNYLFANSDNYVNLLKLATSLVVYDSIVTYAKKNKEVSEEELRNFKADYVALRTATNALLVNPATKDIFYKFTVNDSWCKANERLLSFKDDLFDEGELFVDTIIIDRKKGSDVINFTISVKMAYPVVKTKEDNVEDAGCDCECHCGGHCFDRESRAIDDLKKILKGRGIDLDEVKVRKIDLNDPDDAKMVDKILDNLFN